jgi:hypothetical protein
MKSLIKLACIYLVSSATALATVITFDNLPTGNIPANYSGFQWSGFTTLNALSGAGFGYTNAVVSPSNVIVDIDGRFATLSNSAPFNLNSAYLTAPYDDGLNLEVQGYTGNTLTYDNTFIINTTSAALLNFNYSGITWAKFIPSGGTLHPGYSDHGVHDQNFALDNLTVNVPEPGVTALLLVSILCCAGFRRGNFFMRFCVPAHAHARCKKSPDKPGVPSASK